MLVSYKWLGEWVDLTNETPRSLAEKITLSGIEVEAVYDAGAQVKKTVVGKVEKCIPHPNADRLRVCTVNVGTEERLQIVCGAQNVASGQYVVVALVGAILPGGLKIKKSKLRGEVSEGMICSLTELGVSESNVPRSMAEGIYVFADEAPLGADAMAALFLDDSILDLSLTPNRSDCLSIYGVAYEVAAILGQKLKKAAPQPREITYEKPASGLKLRIEADDNPCYFATLVENIVIKPAPLWMQARLMLAGVRPHSNVVDIGNYVMLEYGQPLHMFDYDRLDSDELLIRKATTGEQIITLDEEERALQSGQLVITNGKKPLAIAGIIGGLSSAIKTDTNRVLLEVAYFKPASIRRASRQLAVRSESSARYEKNIDPLRMELAHEYALQLLGKYANGQVNYKVEKVDNRNIESLTITVALSMINNVLGIELDAETVANLLNNLQFAFQIEADKFIIVVPSRRQDITIAEDIIEEIARLYGYDRLSETVPLLNTQNCGYSEFQHKRRQAYQYLTGTGLNQVLTYSLTSAAKATIANIYSNDINARAIESPLSEERKFLRTSLLPHLLEVVKFNSARQVDDISIFESGSVYIPDDSDISLAEHEHLACVMTGAWHNHKWQGEYKAVDFFVLKGVVEGLLKKYDLGQNYQFIKCEHSYYHPGRCAEIISQSGERLGICGQIHPKISEKITSQAVYGAELSLSQLLTPARKDLVVFDPPRFPTVSRDIALVLDEHITAGVVQAEIENAGGALLKMVSLFDLYTGENIAVEKKSLAFSLQFSDITRTLTDEEVQKNYDNILTAVETKFGAKLRD